MEISNFDWKKYFIVLLFCFFSVCCYADGVDNTLTKKDYFIKFYNLSVDILKTGDWNILIPFYTWHDRFTNTYTREQIERYNESPWGVGFEKTKPVNDRDINGLGVMKFQDSHNRSQYITMYLYERNYFNKYDFKFNLGYGAGFSYRTDMWDYAPFPAVIPIISIGYRNIFIQGTYLLGFDVAFFWIKYSF